MLYRSVFLRDDMKQNLLETQLILAIQQAELKYLTLKKEDTTVTGAAIVRSNELIKKFEAALKVYEGDVRKLKAKVRIGVISIVVAVIIIGCIAYVIYFLSKDDLPKEDQNKFTAVEGGENDDLYQRFIDNEIS